MGIENIGEPYIATAAADENIAADGYEYMLSAIPFIIASVFICVISGLSLIALKSCKNKRKQDNFISGLATSCLMLGIGHCIMWTRKIVMKHKSTTVIPRRQCMLESAHHFFNKIGEYSSAGFILLLSVDRCIAILLPALYQQFTVNNCRQLVIINFAFSTLIYLITLLMPIYLSDIDELISAHCLYSEIFTPRGRKLNSILILCMHYASVLLFIVAASAMRYIQRRQQQLQNTIRQLQWKLEKRLINVVFILLLSTIVTSVLPMTIARVESWNFKSLKDIAEYLFPVLLSLEIAIYCIVNKRIRMSVLQLFNGEMRRITMVRKVFTRSNAPPPAVDTTMATVDHQLA
ncbi:hypothetical protein T4A_10235 [Trichinella pseudospiralis]|uniref:G-protein coupled receptors family 1 profile domain-containing protein n=1 Tax=Trichinella pseudospiralis TaxID=6337 RepID=A0A0V1EIU3_TRIPS|nr:hypothetical protein T4A_10235 [Trichinella pseudospiralis]